MNTSEKLGRRDFLRRSGALLAGGSLLTVFPPACSRLSDLPQVKRSFISMGTFVEFTVLEDNKKLALDAINAAMGAIKKIHNLMSTYDSGSQITAVNRKAGIENVKVDSKFIDVVQRSMEFSRETDGTFDITVLPLLELWGFRQKAVHVPDDRSIQKVMDGVGYSNVQVNAAEGTIGLTHRHTSIDVGGIGKGYAVDKAVEVLKAKGIKNAIVNAGGDIYLMGSPRGENGWLVGLQDPMNNEKVVASVRLKDKAIATSGNYENFVNIDGHRYGHIMDPWKGKPSEQILSATIVASTVTEADALSTTAFVMGSAKSVKFIENRTDAECTCLAAAQNGKGFEFINSRGMKGLHIL